MQVNLTKIFVICDFNQDSSLIRLGFLDKFHTVYEFLSLLILMKYYMEFRLD